MPFNVLGKNKALDGLDESASAITHIGVFTAADPGTGTDFTGTEATGGGYARLSAVWSAAASGQKVNTGAHTFDVAAGTYGFIGFFNASTGNTNNYLGYAPINGTLKGFGTVDAGDVTADVVTSNGHGLVTDDRVQFFNVYAESIPAGITEGTLYFVRSASTADTISFSTTSGGAAVAITGQGEVFWQKVVPETFASTGQITIAASALVLDATAF